MREHPGRRSAYSRLTRPNRPNGPGHEACRAIVRSVVVRRAATAATAQTPTRREMSRALGASARGDHPRITRVPRPAWSDLDDRPGGGDGPTVAGLRRVRAPQPRHNSRCPADRGRDVAVVPPGYNRRMLESRNPGRGARRIPPDATVIPTGRAVGAPRRRSHRCAGVAAPLYPQPRVLCPHVIPRAEGGNSQGYASYDPQARSGSVNPS